MSISNLPRTPGVYIIVNSVNHHMYVGSTVNFRKRYSQHFHDLRRGKHHSDHLQKAYNKYGPDTFAFCVIDHLPDTSKLVEREQLFIDLIRPEYNINRTANRDVLPVRRGSSKQTPAWIAPRVEAARETNLGRKMDPDVKARILATRKVNNEAKRQANPDAFKKDPEEIARSKATRASKRAADPTYGKAKVYVRSAEQNAKHSATMTGRKLSPERIAEREATKKARREAGLYAPIETSDETKAKISEANTGRKRSPDAIARREATKAARRLENPDVYKRDPDPSHMARITEAARIANTGRKRSPDRVEALRASNLGREKSPEHKTKISESKKGKKLSPASISKREATKAAKRLEDPNAYKPTSTPEHLAKMTEAARIANTGKKKPPEEIERMLATRKANKLAKQQEQAQDVQQEKLF